MNLILGGGIAGISAAYHLNLEGYPYMLCEKRGSWGGLCDNFSIKGFLFDYFVHLSFTENDYVKKIFEESAPFYNHYPVSFNYYKGTWLKHPAQNNLAPLPSDEKVKILFDFINKPSISNPSNYYDWLLAQFGEYFTNNFFNAYTLKYWTVESKELGTDWLGKRFSLPELSQILKGAFEEQEDNFYYAKEMRYPIEGGYKSFLSKMASTVNISLNKEAISIDTKKKFVEFADGSTEYYNRLISSVPLPELIKMIKNCPDNVTLAASKLMATSGQLVSLGFNRPDIPKQLWTYVYDKEIFPARYYSPSAKSPNNAPPGKSSLQFETYYSRNSPKKLDQGELVDHIILKGKQMGIFAEEDIEVKDYREVKYANVIFDHNRKSATGCVHEYLNSVGIHYIGRFGEWDYLWSDQSLLSGKKVADMFINNAQ